MNVLLPQAIESEAIALLEQEHCTIIAAPDPKPETVLPLINASRGGVVNEAALVNALQSNQIAGAGLDVFSQEPLPADNPLTRIENVVLTPHTAALTRECVTRMATEAARCVIDVFAGREPQNVANPHVLESGRWKHL